MVYNTSEHLSNLYNSTHATAQAVGGIIPYNINKNYDQNFFFGNLKYSNATFRFSTYDKKGTIDEITIPPSCFRVTQKKSTIDIEVDCLTSRWVSFNSEQVGRLCKWAVSTPKKQSKKEYHFDRLVIIRPLLLDQFWD